MPKTLKERITAKKEEIAELRTEVDALWAKVAPVRKKIKRLNNKAIEAGCELLTMQREAVAKLQADREAAAVKAGKKVKLKDGKE
jgi:uncharacterized coiled-coil DUF342 family protein